MPRKKKTTDGLRILDAAFFRGKPHMQRLLDEEGSNMRIAEDIYVLRTKAGLTQSQLAELVGTTPSVISRLEDADYRGHSLSMLRRVAAALGRRVEVRFLPVAKPTRAA